MTELNPSRQTLEDMPERALRFLSGAGRNLAIFSVLAKYGYDQAEHSEGWRLLKASSEASHVTKAEGANPVEAREATDALDQWDEPWFRIASSALARRFPEQERFVFNNDLSPAAGAGAVLAVSTFLDRLDALESSPDREATREADHAAVALLAERGITSAERQRLRELVAAAQTVPNVPSPDELARAEAAAAAAEEEQLRQLRQLYLWHREWSTIAREAISRRDYLIQLGLASRRSQKKPTEQE